VLDRFLDLACLTYEGQDSPERRAEAAQLLQGNGGLVAGSVHAAAAVGDVAALRALLGEDRGRAIAAGGPRGWVPLLYLCYSRVHPERPGWDPVEAARLLLAAGADPNSFTTITDCRFTAVTGAVGVGEGGVVAQPPHRQARALVELLLDAGANPNDSQALYNTHFLPDDSWLQLFLDRGLAKNTRVNWDANSQASVLDYLLGQAAQQGFTARVALLLQHGADPDGRNHYNKRTHLENARLAGHLGIVALLEGRGAKPAQLTGEEQFRAAVLAGDEAEARRLLAAHPTAGSDPGTLTAAAEHGNLPAVRLALDLGLPIAGAGRDGLTPLHHAARAGHLAVAQELVTCGAPLDARDAVYNGTPLNHVNHSLNAWPTPERQQTFDFLRTR
jgi:ankyrin repeat protein